MSAKSSYNKPVVVVDIDGILADFYFSMTQYLSEKYGKPEYPISSFDAKGWGLDELGLEDSHLTEFWSWVYGGDYFWFNLREMEPGIVQKLSLLLSNQYCVSYLCTTREDTKKRTAQQQTWDWLQKYGWEAPNVVVSERKGDFCYAVNADYFLDDKFSNCVSVCDKSPNTKVFWMALPSQRKYLEEAQKYPQIKILYQMRDFVDIMMEVLWKIK